MTSSETGSDTSSDFLTTPETAALVRRPVETLRYWRWRGEGPPSFKLGRAVMYERADVLAWIEQQKSLTWTGTAPQGRDSAANASRSIPAGRPPRGRGSAQAAIDGGPGGSAA